MTPSDIRRQSVLYDLAHAINRARAELGEKEAAAEAAKLLFPPEEPVVRRKGTRGRTFTRPDFTIEDAK